MTKTKARAFLLCLIVPIIVAFGTLLVFPLSGGEDFNVLIRLILLPILMPLTLIVMPLVVGKEFRTHGLYGALASILILAAIMRFYYHVF